MAHVTKNNHRVWHQQGNVIEDILCELEHPETENFEYIFEGTGGDYKILEKEPGRRRIRLSSHQHGLDVLPELEAHYSENETILQKRLKSLRYILAKAYYGMCCEIIQINCLKKYQFEQSLVFAEGNEIDIYQHLLTRKAELIVKRRKWKEAKIRRDLRNRVNRFELMDIEQEEDDEEQVTE